MQATVMQATVRSYDAGTRSGSVFTDDGAVLSFGPDALDGSGLRLLRPGQRVQFRCDGDPPHVTALTLVTFPLPGEGLSP
jgi:cold shock CspA family protein